MGERAASSISDRTSAGSTGSVLEAAHVAAPEDEVTQRGAEGIVELRGGRLAVVPRLTGAGDRHGGGPAFDLNEARLDGAFDGVRLDESRGHSEAMRDQQRQERDDLDEADVGDDVGVERTLAVGNSRLAAYSTAS